MMRHQSGLFAVARVQDIVISRDKRIKSKEIMDSDKSDNEFRPSSPPPQFYNFMPVCPPMLPYYDQISTEDASRNLCSMQAQRQALELFWNQQLLEIQNTSEFKSHQQLPLARIKRVMKSDGHVKMISANAPLLFSKACEWFISELTLRAWMIAEDNQRRTIQHPDIAMAVRSDGLLNFLTDVVSWNDSQKVQENAKSAEDVESGTVNPLHIPAINANEDILTGNQDAYDPFDKSPSK